MMELQNLPLPPGWDCRLDHLTGKTYFINHITKVTTWDDPRMKNAPLNKQVLQHPLQQTGEVVTQDLKSNSKMSPLLLRTSQTQDSSLNIPDTEESVAKISGMFQTVSDTHIRLLLKKYMKCIFPKAEETVILDVLTNSDNNIQKASDWLKRMGYERKDPVKLQQQAEEARLEEEKQKNKEMSEAELPHIPKIKTTEEKVATKERLQEQYKDLVEQVITIALDSVQYDEDRAKQILQIMMEEDNKTQSSSSCKSEEPEASTDATEVDGLAPGTLSTSQSRQSFKSLLNNDKNDGKNRNINDSSYKSTYLSNFYGANPENVRGANDKLLLTDYIPVRGWNLSLRTGPQTGLAKGPNKNNLINKNYIACGPNSQLCKGPKPGLAKGSIFQHLRNIVNSESRGK